MKHIREMEKKPVISKNTILSCSLCDVKCNTKVQLLSHFSGKKHKEATKLLVETPLTKKMNKSNTTKSSILIENKENNAPQITRKRVQNMHITENSLTKKIRVNSPTKKVPSVLNAKKRKNQYNIASIENVPIKKTKLENVDLIDMSESSTTFGDQTTQIPGTTYEKGGYSESAHGNNFHQLFIILLLLQLRKDGRDFKLGAELKKAGKLDDLYLNYSIESGQLFRFFFQIKHGKSKDAKIALNDIIEGKKRLKLSDLITSLNALLPDIKNPPKVYSVLYTNKTLENADNVMEDCSELLSGMNFPQLFLNLRECKILKSINTKNIDQLVQETGLKHDKIEKLLQQTLFVTDQNGIDVLKNMVKYEIGNLFETNNNDCIEMFFSFMLVKIQDWMIEETGTYIDQEKLESIRSDAIRAITSYFDTNIVR